MRSFLNKKTIIRFAKIVVGLTVYSYLLTKGKIDFDFFRFDNADILAGLFFLETLAFFIGVLRWYRIGRCAYNMDMTFRSAAFISWMGHFFSTFVPSTFGTDFSRVYYGNRISGATKKNLMKITVSDRANSLFGVLICGLFGAVFYLRKVDLFPGFLTLTLFLVVLRMIPKKGLRETLRERGFHLPPFSAVFLSVLNFILKAFSLFIIIYFLMEKRNPNDYYLCLASQFIEGIAVLPANIGIGHVLFDKALIFIEDLNGAQAYNVYFTVKVLFKMTGIAGWLSYREKPRIQK